MGDYVSHADDLQARYGSDHVVLPLEKVRHGPILVRQCSWPNFSAVVMPYCDVVLLTAYDLVDGKQTRKHALGWVNQSVFLSVLRERCVRQDAPTPHLVLDDPLDGEEQYQVMLHIRPTVQAALSDSLQEGV